VSASDTDVPWVRARPVPDLVGRSRIGLGRLLARPVALWERRRAVQLLVVRDLKVRYASSALGYLWSILEPLLLGLTYWFIFTQIFDRTVGEDPYIVFLLAGIFPWTWFSGAVGDSAKVLRNEAKLIRSTNVPREVWIVRVVASKAIEFFLSLPVLLLFVLLYGVSVSWELVLLVPAALLLAVLCLGVGLLLAPLVVLVQDLDRIVRLLLRLGFYASPVIFAVGDVPGKLAGLFVANPLAGIFELCRAGFFPGQLDWSHVGASVLISFALLLLGWAVFARLERTVLKEI
jgi:ABC-2 type transport system permease protein